MAIIITDKFQLRQKNFLDDRQGIASSVSALKSWNYSTVPIPEGFEVYVGGVWYIYRSSHPNDPVTGKFMTRTKSDGVDDLKVRVTRLEFEDGRDVASTFAELLTQNFWLDSTGVNHARAGRIVTVTNDGANNGPWYLISDTYTEASNWIKLIGRGDLVTTTGGAEVSDTSVYTSSMTNATFPKKASPENITTGWVFKEDQVFEKDLSTNTLHANTGTITNLDTTNGTITTLGSDTANIGTGNITTLNSTNGTINNLSSTSGTITTLDSDTANIGTGTINNLSSTAGTITTLGSDTANIGTGNITNLNTTNGTINNLSSTSGTITTLGSDTVNVGTGNITTLNTTNGTINNLSSTSGTITTLGSDTVNVGTGNITTLKTTNGTITNLSSSSGNISGLTSDTVNVGTGNITTLNTTNGTITNLSSSSGNISGLTSRTANIETGNITTANATNLNTSGTTTTNTLRVTSNTNITGETKIEGFEVGSRGSIKDESGETVARVDRIIAEHSELGDFDDKLRDRLRLIGVGNFLKNTSFSGQYESLDLSLSEDTEVSGDTSVFNSKYDDWNVVEPGVTIVDDSDSVTGHSMRLQYASSSISQMTVMTLNQGASYIISWKQKGTVKVQVGNYTLDIKTLLTTSHYKFCYAQITATTTQKELVMFSGGSGNVFEIKFEEGVIPTSWFPSVLDTDPLADELYRFEYLRASFLNHPEGNDLTLSNIFLRNQIKFGDIINGEVTDIYGGISGVVSDGNDVMIWSGSSYEKANELLTNIERDDSYLDSLTPTQLRNLTKALITLNYKSIFTDIYAVGKFKGKHLSENGHELSSYHRMTAYLPSPDGRIAFTDGRLDKVNGSYPTSVNFRSSIIYFNEGLCTDPEGIYIIHTGIEGEMPDQHLQLVFHEGYLVNIERGRAFYNSNYYWY